METLRLNFKELTTGLRSISLLPSDIWFDAKWSSYQTTRLYSVSHLLHHRNESIYSLLNAYKTQSDILLANVCVSILIH